MEKKVYVKPFMKEHELQHRTGLLNMASGKIGINDELDELMIPEEVEGEEGYDKEKDDNYFAGKAW